MHELGHHAEPADHGTGAGLIARHPCSHLLSKMTADNDIEVFLTTFEQSTRYEDWHQPECARLLAPLLTGKAQCMCHALPTAETT